MMPLGSTPLLTDTSGAVVGTTSDSPYGQMTAQSGTVTTPFGFAGQYTDSQTGLVYMRARWYDPGTGQFLSQDPLVLLTQQPYTYVADNPLKYTDPMGLAEGFWEGNGGGFGLGEAINAAPPESSFSGFGQTVTSDTSPGETSGPGCSLNNVAVIGRQADTAVANDWAQHEVLDLPNSEWTIAKND